jgi:hypothetical protein
MDRINQKNNSYKQTETKPYPVLLVHGYVWDATIWKKWEDMLRKDGIQFFSVTFKDSNDKCGSAEQHARELEKIVQDIKEQSGAQRTIRRSKDKHSGS